MSDLTRDDVAHLAGLARIDLSDAELDRMPMSHPMPIVNVTRADVVRPSLSPQDALSGAPQSQQQRFSVPRILDQD